MQVSDVTLMNNQNYVSAFHEDFPFLFIYYFYIILHFPKTCIFVVQLMLSFFRNFSTRKSAVHV